jgi:endonuclease-3
MEGKIEKITKVLSERYPIEHFFGEPFRVLITTILSHRTRDENTHNASNRLFSRYKTPHQIANLPLDLLEDLIKPCGFYRVKAKRIKEVSGIIQSRFGGKVPADLESLLTLPGVGRKTANCVLAYGYGIPAIPVDTHVHRVSNRLGLVSTRLPDETEEALKGVVPRPLWMNLNALLVRFGQEVCLPMNPRCKVCPIHDLCDTP